MLTIIPSLAIASLGISALAESHEPEAQAIGKELNILKGPYLQWPTKSSIKVMWETSVPATSKVTYFDAKIGPVERSKLYEIVKESARTVEDTVLTTIHCVTLTGLATDTNYFYKVSSTDEQGKVVESSENPLKTAVRADEPFSFAVTSETGGWGKWSKPNVNEQLFAQLVRYRPEFAVFVGDVVGWGRIYEDWDEFFFGPGGEFFKSTPFYLAFGNHEECSPWFYKFTSYPPPGNYYSFDYGNAHFLVLDCTVGTEALCETGANREMEYVPQLYASPEKQAFSPGSPQYEFMVKDLKSSRAAWKFVFFHYPPYVSGGISEEGMRALSPIFEKHGVDIVFNSHHVGLYERTHPLRNNKIDLDSGVIYVIAGGPGTSTWLHPKRSWFTAEALAVPHFVQVSIVERTLELKGVDVDGHVFDAMRLTKPAAE